MRLFKKCVFWFVLPLVGLLIILILFGRQWVFSYLSPPDTFVLADAPAAPDFDNQYFWVAHPDKKDTSDLVPIGIDTSGDITNKAVDVFFVHSTGFVGVLEEPVRELFPAPLGFCLLIFGTWVRVYSCARI